MGTWISSIVIFIVFVAVLFLAYVTAKFLGGKAKQVMKGKNINIIESISLGLDKQLHLVKVGEKYILIATAGKNIQMLTDISAKEMGELVTEAGMENSTDQFKEIFDKYIDGIGKKIRKIKNKPSVKSDITEEQSNGLNKISKNLSNMKAINKKLMKNQNFGDEKFYEITNDKRNVGER